MVPGIQWYTGLQQSLWWRWVVLAVPDCRHLRPVRCTRWQGASLRLASDPGLAQQVSILASGRGVNVLGIMCIALCGVRGVRDARGWGSAGAASFRVLAFSVWRGGAGVCGWASGDVPEKIKAEGQRCHKLWIAASRAQGEEQPSQDSSRGAGLMTG